MSERNQRKKVECFIDPFHCFPSYPSVDASFQVPRKSKMWTRSSVPFVQSRGALQKKKTFEVESPRWKEKSSSAEAFHSIWKAAGEDWWQAIESFLFGTVRSKVVVGFSSLKRNPTVSILRRATEPGKLFLSFFFFLSLHPRLRSERDGTRVSEFVAINRAASTHCSAIFGARWDDALKRFVFVKSIRLDTMR